MAFKSDTSRSTRWASLMPSCSGSFSAQKKHMSTSLGLSPSRVSTRLPPKIASPVRLSWRSGWPLLARYFALVVSVPSGYLTVRGTWATLAMYSSQNVDAWVHIFRSAANDPSCSSVGRSYVYRRTGDRSRSVYIAFFVVLVWLLFAPPATMPEPSPLGGSETATEAEADSENDEARDLFSEHDDAMATAEATRAADATAALRAARRERWLGKFPLEKGACCMVCLFALS
mmetsp:Transcript_28098/g.54763  ORF Transcript_28098/g.54763 Transcript_28098/m.54763 type:complete len:230 (+) Transcript_28098:237-926(+)